MTTAARDALRNADSGRRGTPSITTGAPDTTFVALLTAACVCGWLPYWLANFPAVMTPDSLDQWRQAVTGRYTDWHPVVHTLLIRGAMSVWANPAAAIAVHITLMALAVGYTFRVLRDRGVSRVAVVAVAGAFMLYPVFGAMLCTLWKDIPYAACFLAFTMALADANDHRHPRRSWWMLLTSGTAMTLFRHNGLVSVVAGLLALAVAQRPRWRPPVSVLLVLSAIVLGVTLAIGRQLRPARAPISEALAIPLQQAGGVLAEGCTLSATQRAQLNAILPLSIWKQQYDPQMVDRIKFLPDFHPQVIAEQPAAYARLWLQLLAEYPSAMLRAWWRQVSSIWDPRRSARGVFPSGIVPNEFGLRPTGAGDGVGRLIGKITRAMEVGVLSWLHRPAVMNLALLVAAVATQRRFGLPAIVPFAPIVAAMMVLLCFMPVSDFRYFFPALAIAPPLVALAGRKRNPTMERGAEAALPPAT